MAGPPLIGVTSYAQEASWGVWRRPAALLPRAYLRAVQAAGGVAVLLPPQPPAGAERALAALDGLVLSGGADLDPAAYHAAPHPSSEPPEPERDQWELALADLAISGGLPTLGVCRGMQVLNVALGGDLDQHLPDRPGAGPHRGAAGVFAEQEIRVQPGSMLATILGGAGAVRCYHHQAVRRLGRGLRPVAWAGDGTVEAVEADGAGFLLGVQWHPEEDAADARLFAALVEAARARRD
jgi:gamma-glutamyl-gamma-aminobutyrate hydrolase PuuD